MARIQNVLLLGVDVGPTYKCRVDSMTTAEKKAEFLFYTGRSKGSRLSFSEVKDLEYLTERLYEALPDGPFLLKVESVLGTIRDEIARVQTSLSKDSRGHA